MFNEIYWLTRLTAIQSFLECASVFSFMAFLILIVFYAIISIESHGEAHEILDNFKLLLKLFAVVFIVSGILSVFIPTRNDLAMIYGWEALKSESSQQFFSELMKKLGEKW